MTAEERVSARLPVLLGLLVALAFALAAPFGLPSLKTVVGADRILRGDVPYRDFWTMYAPGSFYAVAAVFRVFGRELLVQSLAAALSMGVAAALWCDLVRRSGASASVTVVLGACFLLVLWSPGIEWASYPTALPFLLYALRGVHRRLAGDPRGSARGLYPAGLALGLAAACKHDVGGYAALALGGALLLAPWIDRARPWRVALRDWALLAAGALTSALPVVVWVAWSAGAEAWRQLFVFPATDFPLVFSDPYPDWLPPFELIGAWLEQPLGLRQAQAAGLGVSAWGVCILPHLFFWPALALLVLRGRRLAPSTRVTVAAWLLWIPFFWSAAHVQQNTHVWSMAFGCFALWSLAWRAARGRAARIGLAVALALYAGAHAVRPLMSAALVARGAGDLQTVGLDGARGVLVSGQDARLYRTLVERLQAEVPPGEPIHVGVRRNDAIVISNQRFYYLADRPCATRHNELHPGVTDRAPVQREMIADLRAAGVRRMILWDFGWPADRLERIAARRREVIPDAGSTLLDEYVRAHFEEELRVGQYALWKMRE